jgi:hypothetical protein
MPNHRKGVNLTGFKGINNVGSPDNTSDKYLKKALNVNIDKTGNIAKRKGYTKVIDGTFTSLWASENGLGCYGVLNNDLVQVYPDYSTLLVKEDVGSETLSFEEVDGIIYYSSTNSNGIISNGARREWGIERNWLSPTLTPTTGSLDTGVYQVNFTWVYSDGRESGCARSSIISVANNSGISLNIPSAPNGVLYARIYCSTSNGNTLYFHGMTVPSSTYLIDDAFALVDPLRFFNIDKAPLGSIIRYYRGRMYIASGNILWYSEPFQYEQFRLDSNYFEFPEEIREVMPVEDGIWIGSDRLYYLSGEEPDKFKRTVKEHIKIVAGTSTRISGSYIHMDNTPIGYKWLVTSNIGIWVLFNQGLCINLTAENVALDQADKGASLFLQDSGMNMYMSILQTNSNPNNSIMGDLVETTIVRNGVIIN